MTHTSLSELIGWLEDLRSKKQRVVAAIDGRGGAGKSSLARAIVAALPRSMHIEHDWFHLPKHQVAGDLRFDHSRLLSELLCPFQAGAQRISFLRYNWGYLAGTLDGFHESPTIIEDVDIVVLEGCNTLHPLVVEHLDFKIWLDTDPALAMQRGIKRDIEEYKLDPQRVHAAWKEWSFFEAQRLARDNRQQRADVVITGWSM